MCNRAELRKFPRTAGWRRGYAADCKAPLETFNIRALGDFGCQDKPETPRERDNSSVYPREVSSAPIHSLPARLAAAEALCHAIAACEREDAAFIMAGVLAELSAGPPQPALLGVMDEARTWAEWASPIERKAYAVACFLAMPPKVRAEFLAWALARASEGGR